MRILAKQFIVCLLTLGFIFVFTGCNKDDDGKGRAYTDTEAYTYAVSGKRLVISFVYKDSEYPQDNEYMEGVFTLNDDGFVVSGEITDEYEDAPYAYQCFYNNDRQLV